MKRSPLGSFEVRAFAAQGLGDQEALGRRVVQAGRVELVEFQVADPAAGAPGHGDAVDRWRRPGCWWQR